jgi:hypothetical protein
MSQQGSVRGVAGQMDRHIESRIFPTGDTGIFHRPQSSDAAHVVVYIGIVRFSFPLELNRNLPIRMHYWTINDFSEQCRCSVFS